jgi:GTP pyrophosphokinase
MIESEFKKYNRSYTDAQFDEIVANVAQRNGFASPDDLFNTLGYGGMAITKIATKLRDEFDRTVKPEVVEPTVIEADQVKVATPNRKTRGTGGIVVDGERGCQVKFARCCNPLPGDEVVGFITKGFGISIHKTDCPNVIQGKENPENATRWVEAHWEKGDASSDQSMYEAQITVHVKDRLGIVADISVALSDMRVFLLQINSVAGATPDDSIINLKISCKNVEHYHSIVSRLRAINGVIDVVRGFS